MSDEQQCAWNIAAIIQRFRELGKNYEADVIESQAKHIQRLIDELTSCERQLAEAKARSAEGGVT